MKKLTRIYNLIFYFYPEEFSIKTLYNGAFLSFKESVGVEIGLLNNWAMFD